MQYLYTGDFHFGADLEGQEHSLEYLFEFLRVSDEYILEDVSLKSFYDFQVKLHCEECLINFLTVDNFHLISEHAELYNTERLKEFCNWFYRRHASFIVTSEMQQLSMTTAPNALIGNKVSQMREDEEEEEEE